MSSQVSGKIISNLKYYTRVNDQLFLIFYDILRLEILPAMYTLSQETIRESAPQKGGSK